MIRARRNLVLLVAAALAVVAAWLATRRGTSAAPGLDEICALARAGRFDQAQAELARHLRAFPDQPIAHQLMAEFATDRPDPQPKLALEHLRQIHPDTPERAARVQFFMGKAHHQEARFDLAESCWTEALRLDPTVPEAGAALFSLLEVQGRVEEARKLGLMLFAIEPDPRDLVRWLINIARLDVDTPSPSMVATNLEPLARQVPHNLHVAVALGLALIRDSRGEKGLAVLRDARRRHPYAPEAWDALLSGLDEAGRPDELAREFGLLPETLADDPRFARHAGRAAQNSQDWNSAVRAFRRAHEFQPFDGVTLYRLSRVLRAAGETVEAERVGQHLADFQAASKQLRKTVDEALAIKTLGISPQKDIYHRMADLRERLGHPEEARAWHRLVLRDDPREAVSLAALQRLELP